MSKVFTNIKQKIIGATKYINVSVFLITFLIGLIYIYNFDYNRKVEVYPTPNNIDKIEYKRLLTSQIYKRHCFCHFYPD